MAKKTWTVHTTKGKILGPYNVPVSVVETYDSCRKSHRVQAIQPAGADYMDCLDRGDFVESIEYRSRYSPITPTHP